MRFCDYDVKAEPEGGEAGYVLVKNQKGRGTVVYYNGNGQLNDAIPGDAPTGGGSWFAGVSDSGLRYVAGFYSWGYARKIFRRLTAEDRERYVEYS